MTDSHSEKESGTIEVVTAEITRARMELADTVEALFDKVNVKAHAKRAIRTAKTQVADKVSDGGHWIADHRVALFAVGAGIVLIAIAVTRNRTQR